MIVIQPRDHRNACRFFPTMLKHPKHITASLYFVFPFDSSLVIDEKSGDGQDDNTKDPDQNNDPTAIFHMKTFPPPFQFLFVFKIFC